MILVIADDFTGAAETAAVGLRYGLSADVQTRLDLAGAPALISLDTHTRSLPADRVPDRLRGLLSDLPEKRPRLFKKVDSVLRGPVLAELVVLSEIFEKNRVLLVPANPSLGRVIRDGRYYIGGTPIDQTDFGQDPEHPAASSDVSELLGLFRSVTACRAKARDNLPPDGVIVGDTETNSDLAFWARALDGNTLAAGAAEFFAAFLEQPGGQARVRGPEGFSVLRSKGTTLLVSGSSSEYSRKLSLHLKARGVPVCPMPEDLFRGIPTLEQSLESWAEEVTSCLRSRSVVRVSVDRPLNTDPKVPERLAHHLSGLIERVLSRCKIERVCVEGGATVSTLVRFLGWERLQVLDELGPGSVVMRPAGATRPLLITKPGSYPWPERFLETLFAGA